jgi:hypothetical protein
VPADDGATLVRSAPFVKHPSLQIDRRPWNPPVGRGVRRRVSRPVQLCHNSSSVSLDRSGAPLLQAPRTGSNDYALRRRISDHCPRASAPPKRNAIGTSLNTGIRATGAQNFTATARGHVVEQSPPQPFGYQHPAFLEWISRAISRFRRRG